MSKSRSIIAAWALIYYSNHVVLCATSSNLSSCIAWMCCRMSTPIKQLVWACPDLSSRRGHRSLLQSCCCWCYVIQPVYHILHECVIGCPILSSMYEHVPIYNSTYRLGLYTFLHSLRSNLKPSRPLQLWFDARETSLARNSMNVFEAVQFYQACMSMSRSIYNPIYRLWLYTFLHSLHSNFSPSLPLQLWFEAPCKASLARDKYVMQSTQKGVEGATALYVCL